jgi:alpha-amylase
MCTKWFADGAVHKHFSPNATPHDAVIAYMNVLDDLERRAASAAASAAAAPAAAAPARPHAPAGPRPATEPSRRPSRRGRKVPRRR